MATLSQAQAANGHAAKQAAETPCAQNDKTSPAPSSDGLLPADEWRPGEPPLHGPLVDAVRREIRCQLLPIHEQIGRVIDSAKAVAARVGDVLRWLAWVLLGVASTLAVGGLAALVTLLRMLRVLRSLARLVDLAAAERSGESNR